MKKRTAMRELVVQLRIKTGDFNVVIQVDGITVKSASWHVQATCQNELLYVYSKPNRINNVNIIPKIFSIQQKKNQTFPQSVLKLASEHIIFLIITLTIISL